MVTLERERLSRELNSARMIEIRKHALAAFNAWEATLPPEIRAQNKRIADLQEERRRLEEAHPDIDFSDIFGD